MWNNIFKYRWAKNFTNKNCRDLLKTSSIFAEAFTDKVFKINSYTIA